MNEEYISEVGEIAPRPSAVRRSGRIEYARKVRKLRSAYNSTANRKPVEDQQIGRQRNQGRSYIPEEQGKPSKQQNQTLKPLPGAADDPTYNADSTIPQVTGEAAKGVASKQAASEQKNVDPVEDSQSILHNKQTDSGNSISPALANNNNSIVVEEEVVSTFMSTFDDIQEGNDARQENTVDGDNKSTPLNKSTAAAPSVADKAKDKRSKVQPDYRHPSYQRQLRARVYHRPHTNQTVVASSDIDDNDSKSTTSGLSQPSWVSRRMQREDERDELSQTSVSNSKRRARMAKRKKREKKPMRKKYASDESRNTNTMGYVVSQAFDKMLGYAGGHHHYNEDGYSSEESDNIMNDLQEAILTTFGCSVPQPKPANRVVEDDTTIESNEHSGARHIRTDSNLIRSGSNMSESVLSNVSGSNVESVLSFDTTEELADFSKEKRVPSTTSYKVPDAYDAEPPKIPLQKDNDSLYSDDLYSNILDPDFEPVNLLEEGDNMLDSMGKDIMNVANTKVDEMFTSIGSYLGSPTPSTAEPAETDTPEAKSEAKEKDSDTNNDTLNSTADTALMTSLSNVTEPLQVIKENEGEGSPRREESNHNHANHDRSDLAEITSDNEFVAFEDRFEVNVFETVEPVGGSVVKTEIPLAPTASDENLFHSIDEHNSEVKDDSGLKSLIKPNKKDTSSSLKDSEIDAPQGETPFATSTQKQTASAKTTTDSTTLDRDGSSRAVIAKGEVKAASTAAESSKTGKDTAAIPEKKASKTSFQAATKAPQNKKSKKFGGFKGLIRRSFKKKSKGKKKSNSTPLASELAELQIEHPADITSTQKETEESVKTSSIPASQGKNSVASPESTSNSAPKEEKPTTDAELGLAIQPKPDNSVNDDAWVDFSDTNKSSNTNAPLSRPTTPVRDPDSAMDTPKMSNLGLEGRTLTRPVSGTNLADLPGIDEAKSFREDPPARKDEETTGEEEVNRTPQLDPPAATGLQASSNVPEKKDNGFDVSFDQGDAFDKQQRAPTNVETTKSTVSGTSFDDADKEVSFEKFNVEKFDLNTTGDTWESFGDNSDDVGAAAYRQKMLEDAKKNLPMAPPLAEF